MSDRDRVGIKNRLKKWDDLKVERESRQESMTNEFVKETWGAAGGVGGRAKKG